MSRSIDETIAYYQSAEQRRVAVKRALYANPQDPRLLKLRDQLSDAHHIQRALQQGVFICYTRSDELFALELYEALRDQGVQPWLDTLAIGMDADWQTEVRQALDRSGLVLAVMSPLSIQSQWTAEERQYALGRGKLLLPVLHRPCEVRDTALWLAPVDFTQSRTSGFYQLQQVLGISQAQSA
jgi:hypothetical protein